MAVATEQSDSIAPAPATYRAAVVHSFSEPLTVEQVTPSALKAGQIRVQVEASGLCHI